MLEGWPPGHHRCPAACCQDLCHTQTDPLLLLIPVPFTDPGLCLPARFLSLLPHRPGTPPPQGALSAVSAPSSASTGAQPTRSLDGACGSRVTQLQGVDEDLCRLLPGDEGQLERAGAWASAWTSRRGPRHRLLQHRAAGCPGVGAALQLVWGKRWGQAAGQALPRSDRPAAAPAGQRSGSNRAACPPGWAAGQESPPGAGTQPSGTAVGWEGRARARGTGGQRGREKGRMRGRETDVQTHRGEIPRQTGPGRGTVRREQETEWSREDPQPGLRPSLTGPWASREAPAELDKAGS